MDIMGILEIIARLLGALIACGLVYFIPKINTWLNEKIGEDKAAKLKRIVAELVKAAEQLYKEEDPDGSIRKKYVEGQLEALGYEVTAYVNNLIESEVLNLNYLK